MYNDDNHVGRDAWLDDEWKEAVAPLIERLGFGDDFDHEAIQNLLDDYYNDEEYAQVLLSEFDEEELIILEGGKAFDELMVDRYHDRAISAMVDDYYD